VRKFLIWTGVIMLLAAALAGGGYWAWWNYYARWRPVTITENQAEIQRLLDRASYVSPGASGPALYMISFRSCPECIRYETEEFPKLQAGGVDTRVIVFARPDVEGLSKSTAAERSTVAELWLRRDWSLYERWTAVPHASWKAAGLPVADDSLVGSAVIEAGRKFVNDLRPLLQNNDVSLAFPLLIWRDKDGFLKACACTDSRSYRFVRQDLGAPDRAPPRPAAAQPPQPLPTPAPAAPPADAPAEATSPDVPPTEPSPQEGEAVGPATGQPVNPPADAPAASGIRPL
jgi:hypothetical protein